MIFRSLPAEPVVGSVAGEIARNTHNLMLLRQGEHEQLLQETQQALDTDLTILALAGHDAGVPGPLVKPLRNALNYYEKYPMATGDSETDAAVMEFLAHVAGTAPP
jgi:hypothetical protein